jgi:hypothetical protein
VSTAWSVTSDDDEGIERGGAGFGVIIVMVARAEGFLLLGSFYHVLVALNKSAMFQAKWFVHLIF